MAKAGQRFTHDRWLEPNWHPDIAKDQKYTDAPKAEMVVVKVASGQVWYDFDATTLVNIKGRWVMDEAKFDERFPASGESHVYVQASERAHAHSRRKA